MTIILSQCGDDSTETIQCISNNPPCNQTDHDGNPCEACRELIQIEAQVEELHSKLKDLHTKHVSISASNRKIFHKCSIDKLPNEIMSDIVLRVCLPGIHPFCYFERGSSLKEPKPLYPLRFAKVCHRWRDLVFSTPKLWSSFSIRVNNPNMPLINHHLRLSGPTSRLSIRLFAKFHEAIKDDAVFNAMALINDNIHRIAYLCLDVPERLYTALTSSSRTIAEAAPLLEEFHIHRNDIGFQSCSTNFKLCTNPPRPRKVYIEDYHPSKIQLDWPHVAQLRLQCRKLHSLDVVNVLSDAKSLVEFDCDSSILDNMTRLSTGIPIVHDSIRKAMIRSSDSSCQVFLNITMSSLESLTIQSFGSPEWELFPAFLQRSASQLTSLELSFGGQPSGEDLINIFQYTLVLQSLKLHFNGSQHIGDARLLPLPKRLSMPVSQVLGPAGDPILLPHLEKLHLSGNLHVQYSPYLKIMENRLAPIALAGGGQVRALDELTIKPKSPKERQVAVTKPVLRQILDLRKAKKTVLIFWHHKFSDQKLDLVEDAIASYKDLV